MDEFAEESSLQRNYGEVITEEKEAIFSEDIANCHETFAYSHQPGNELDIKYTPQTQTHDCIDSEILYDEDTGNYYKKIKGHSAIVGRFMNKEKNEIEKKYKCQLIVPKEQFKKSRKKEIDIVIQSVTHEEVIKCEKIIREKFAEARQKITPRYFVALPILDDNFHKQYIRLIDDIINDDGISPDNKILKQFMPPQRLHLTFSVLRLLTDEDIQQAKECLDNLFETRIREIMGDEHSLQLEFSELEHFPNCAQNKTNVVYAKVSSPDDRLQRIADAIDDSLAQAGFALDRKTKQVKLHMTVINTKYISWSRKRRFIDASALFDKFGLLNFQPVIADQIHLLEMRSDPLTKMYKTIYSKVL